jgi:short-subunit dehydrogenase
MRILPYKFALVTGASNGIGEGLARALAKRNISLVLVARRKEKLESLAAELKSNSIQVIVVPLDLTVPTADEILWKELQKRSIEIDLLVNNAGFGSYGFFHEAIPEKQFEMIDLNIKALVKLTHRFLPSMIKKDHGAILNVSSLSGFQPVPFMATYAATKAFVTNFSLALSSELSETGVRVIALCPGRTETGFQTTAGSNKIRIRSRKASVEQVVAVAMKALAGGQAVAVEGFTNMCIQQIQRFLPRKLILKVAYRVFKPKPEKELL